jgi:hypothetical protein
LLAGKEITRMDVDGSGLANRKSRRRDPGRLSRSRMQRGVWWKEFLVDPTVQTVYAGF